MIKAEELRIGNLVFNSFTKSNQLISYHEIRILSIGLRNHYTPIPLTEEWLLKLGYKHINTLHDGTKSFEGYPYLYFKDGIARISTKTPDINYIHQLQNLYYALNGQEITISTGE